MLDRDQPRRSDAGSGAAALYVGNKAVASNKPVISAVVPQTARPGDLLVITGSNILGGGTPVQVQVHMAQFGSLTVQGDATDSRVNALLAAMSREDLPVAEFAFPGPLRDQLVAAIRRTFPLVET